MIRRSSVLLVLLVASLGQCSGWIRTGTTGPGSVPRGPTESEPNDDASHADPLPASWPLVVTGTIERTASRDGRPSGDRDRFGFRAPASGWLLAALTMPVGADDDLALFSGDGRRLATARSDNLDPSVGRVEHLFAEVAGGRNYQIEVAGHAGSPGPYRLRIEVRARSVPPESGTRVTGKMARPRCFHAMALLPDGRALVAGGTTNAGSRPKALLHSLRGTELFDPRSGTFTAGPGTGAARFGPTATTLSDGRVLIAGGDIGGTAVLYDPYRGRMTKTDIRLPGGNRFLQTATLLPDGRVLLAGGVRLVFRLPLRAATVATTAVFDPKSGTFSEGPRLHAARYSHGACLLRDGRVLLTGGVGLSTTEIVDVRDGAATSVVGPRMTCVRDDHSATTLSDGRILVTGGQNRHGRSLALAEILDDPEAGPGSRFRALSSRLSQARSDHQAVLLPDGSVVLFGGEYDDGTNRHDRILSTVDRFRPGPEVFESLPRLTVGRDDCRVLGLMDGRILVTGGENAASLSIPDAELYSVK